ncbi:MAG: cysteine desulfurase [Eubacteriales bacterium]|nr:cysteine desulfurase [Eubacteriales bacterium]
MPEAKLEAYLDNSATTRPCPAAVEAMAECMRGGFYNPSALYGHAVEAERALYRARVTVAASVEAGEGNVVFTSGGTESDNLAIFGTLGALRGQGTVLYSAAEHPAVKNACREAAGQYGCDVAEIPLNARGMLDLSAFEKMLTPQVRLICVMQVCNETGAVMPLKEVVALRDACVPLAAIHVDGVQGYLRVPFSMRALGVQTYAISAHKVHGPKGVGALIVREGLRLKPQMFGGGQQNNLRSGTENTSGIAGFAAAVAQYLPLEAAQIKLGEMKRIAVETLSARVPGFQVLGPALNDSDAAPHILYAAFPPVRAETMVHALEAVGVMVGTGSACSSKKSKRSDVLIAMGVPPKLMDSAVRLSFGVDNTVEEIRYACDAISSQYQLLARFTRR